MDLLQRVYEAWNREGVGAFETLRGSIDPAVEFREAPEFPGAGTHRGVEEWRAAMAVQLDAWDKIVFEPEEFVENGDEVLAVVRVLTRGKATGIDTERVIFHLVTIRDDRVLRWRGRWRHRGAPPVSGSSDSPPSAILGGRCRGRTWRR